jgi:hypothetical protein
MALNFKLTPMVHTYINNKFMIKKVISTSLFLSAVFFISVGFNRLSASTYHHTGKSSVRSQKNSPPDTGWRQLFNGKDLSGWKQVGPGSRYVENGLTGSHGGMGLLYWTK